SSARSSLGAPDSEAVSANIISMAKISAVFIEASSFVGGAVPTAGTWRMSLDWRQRLGQNDRVIHGRLLEIEKLIKLAIDAQVDVQGRFNWFHGDLVANRRRAGRQRQRHR